MLKGDSKKNSTEVLYKTIKVRIQKTTNYNIFIGRNILKDTAKIIKSTLSDIDKRIIIITTSPIAKLHIESLVGSLRAGGFSADVIEIPDGEQSKSLKQVSLLYEQLIRKDICRRTVIVGFGGGVVGDLSGFIAATLLRGLPFIQIPTTLVGQLDSAIGGKVGVNLTVGKNLVGAFYQPSCVISDVSLLKTLDTNNLKDGLAEAIKYGVIKDEALFEYLKNNAKVIMSKGERELLHIIEVCSNIKAQIISEDEREGGVRMLLNFGHTLGHAIEVAGDYTTLSHGATVSIGMHFDAKLALKLGLITYQDYCRIAEVLQLYSLPLFTSAVEADKVFSALVFDKKRSAQKKLRWVLPVKIGQAKIFEDIDMNIVKELIGEVIY